MAYRISNGPCYSHLTAHLSSSIIPQSPYYSSKMNAEPALNNLRPEISTADVQRSSGLQASNDPSSERLEVKDTKDQTQDVKYPSTATGLMVMVACVLSLFLLSLVSSFQMTRNCPNSLGLRTERYSEQPFLQSRGNSVRPNSSSHNCFHH